MEAGLSGEALKTACGSVVFSVCTLLDNSSSFEVNGKEYSPYLAFSDNDETLFYPGGNSFLHEYVFGVLEDLFSRGKAAK